MPDIPRSPEFEKLLTTLTTGPATQLLKTLTQELNEVQFFPMTEDKPLTYAMVLVFTHPPEDLEEKALRMTLYANFLEELFVKLGIEMLEAVPNNTIAHIDATYLDRRQEQVLGFIDQLVSLRSVFAEHMELRRPPAEGAQKFIMLQLMASLEPMPKSPRFYSLRVECEVIAIVRAPSGACLAGATLYNTLDEQKGSSDS